MEKKIYESPKLTVEEFAANRNYAAQCGTEEISRITYWPKDITLNCFIEGEEVCFSDLAHTVNPSTGAHEACSTITCVSPDCTGGSGYFGHWSGDSSLGLPAGNYLAWAGAPTGSDMPSSAQQSALSSCMTALSGGSITEGKGWHASYVDDNEAITEIIYGWSNNH